MASPASRVGQKIRTPSHEQPVFKSLRQSAQSKFRMHTRRRKALAADYSDAVIQNQRLSSNSSRDERIAVLADTLFSRGVRHVGTSTNVGFLPYGNPATPEVMFCGREAVGTTSLLRAVFKSNDAIIKGSGGKRRQGMNFYEVGQAFNVVETPGYGHPITQWSTVLQHAVLLRNFVYSRPSLKMLYFCMEYDNRYGFLYRDLDTIRFLKEELPNFTIVVTKADKIGDMPGLRRDFARQGIVHPIISTSAVTLGGIDTLRFDMVSNAFHALPDEDLTISAARRVSKRLLSREQVALIRPDQAPPLLPTTVDEEATEWRQELLSERLSEEKAKTSFSNSSSPMLLSSAKAVAGNDRGKVSNTGGEMETVAVVEPLFVGDMGKNPLTSDAAGAQPKSLTNIAHGQNDGDNSQLSTITATSNSLSQVDLAEWKAASKALQQRREKLARSIMKQLSPESVQRVQAESPWRNPLVWPSFVRPMEESRRRNEIRHPDDPDNPYLTVPRYVATKPELNFRRPNLPRWSRRKKFENIKGNYLPEKAFSVTSRYTLPYFPDIVDVKMLPSPRAFITDHHTPEGREFGLKLAAATVGMQTFALEKANPVTGVATGEEGRIEGLAEELRRLQETLPPPRLPI